MKIAKAHRFAIFNRSFGIVVTTRELHRYGFVAIVLLEDSAGSIRRRAPTFYRYEFSLLLRDLHTGGRDDSGTRTSGAETVKRINRSGERVIGPQIS